MSLPRRSLRTVRLLLAVGLLVCGLAQLAPGPGTAGAAVRHVSGYRATVLGWSSWYGSYDLGAEGTTWCIDHGLRAPDPALRYVATSLSGVAAGTQAALAWAFGRYGPGADRVTSAALMLVGHDLMGARYPYGALRVTDLTARSIAGFGADGPAILARAIAIRADAVARSHLRAPWRLVVEAPRPAPGRAGTGTVRLTAGGVGVPGIAVRVAATGATVAAPATVTTGADGSARFTYTAGAGAVRVSASATVPDLRLQAFAPTTARAQRVARAGVLPLTAAVESAAPTTTSTSTTTSSTTSTTSSTTTSTSTSTSTTTSTTTPTPTSTTSTSTVPATPTSTTTTTTTVPATAVPTTTIPATTSTSTTTPAPTTTSAPTTTAPPVSVTTPTPPPPPGPPALARTGADLGALGATGSGLVLLGTSLPLPRRRRPK